MREDEILARGFKRHYRQSPLTDPWEPLYSKSVDGKTVVAIHAAEQHCNSRGFVHGGLITALADNAMGLSCGTQHKGIKGLVTSTLNMEFLTPCEKGQWIEFVTHTVKIGKRLDAAQGKVLADGKPAAFTSATFSVLN
jgi:uncharacterized protein (TIGR00369 family)